MRNMSFALTVRQIKDKTKFVTRRIGWDFLRVGDYVQAVEKCQGLKKGEKAVKLCVVKIVGVREEPLTMVTKSECILEGFPEMDPEEFIEMFCRANKCHRSTVVRRIKFEYVIINIYGYEGLFGYHGDQE